MGYDVLVCKLQLGGKWLSIYAIHVDLIFPSAALNSCGTYSHVMPESHCLTRLMSYQSRSQIRQ